MESSMAQFLQIKHAKLHSGKEYVMPYSFSILQ